MNAYQITAPARADLFDIWMHIAQDSPDAADRVIDALEAAMSRAAEFPLLGFRRSDVHHPRYRFWLAYSYLIVYLPDTEPLQIIRVLHRHRNLPAALEK